MNTTQTESESAPPKGRLIAAVTLFLIALACPITGTVIIASDLPNELKIAAGFLYFPIPEILDVAAIAILGKPGFTWLKSKVLGFLRKHGPPAEVSRARYRLGLVLFLLPLVFGWLHPYLGHHLPGFAENRVAFNVLGDVLFFASFFVLGGDFWDKVRALFVYSANFPQAQPTMAQRS